MNHPADLSSTFCHAILDAALYVRLDGERDGPSALTTFKKAAHALTPPSPLHRRENRIRHETDCYGLSNLFWSAHAIGGAAVLIQFIN